MIKFLAFVIAGVILVSAKDLAFREKRGHHQHQGPIWVPEHCWENALHHTKDPFCALLIAQLNCSEPPSIEHGSHSTSYSTTQNSTVNYYCNEGYTLTGPEVIRCELVQERKGMFWTQPPVCKIGGCKAIPEIEHGYHLATDTTTFGSVVRYTCDEGYYMKDKDSIKCGLNGNKTTPSWSKPYPQCTEMLCNRPVITNGVILLPGMVISTPAPDTTVMTTTEPQSTTTEPPVTTTTEYTTTADYGTTTHAPEYSNETTETVNTQNATTELPSALNNTVPEAADEVNGTDAVTPEANNFTTTAMPDNTNETSTDIPDVSNETTTAAPDNSNAPITTTMAVSTEATTTTTLPPPTTTTTVSPYTYIANETFQINDTIIYHCNSGYALVSSVNPENVGNDLEARCELKTGGTGGTAPDTKITAWSATASCVPVCGPVPEVVNANHTEPANTVQGATVDYSCYTGFELVGSQQVECLATGQWSALPFCRGCGNAPDVEHGTHNADYSSTVNSTVSYVCNEGYSMIGLEVITCNPISQSPYGKWTDPPTCTGSCDAAPLIANGDHTDPESRLVGANVTYFCLDGFEMNGTANVVCQSNGNWSQTPVCYPVCVSLPPIPNLGQTIRYTANETDQVKIVCEERYTLIGNDTLTCNGGHWSTPFPYCQCEIKPSDIVFIIDGSGSLGPHGFRSTLEFVVDMVSRFPVETTNFGLLTFSTGALVQFYLNEYVNDTEGLKERIKNTTYPTGGTHTYAGLEFARTDMFQVKNGMRPNVSHTAIVVTDGHSDNFNETVDQAELLKNSGVTIYSVGVGLTDENELQLIASNATYVFTVDNYDRIDEIAGPLAGISCASSHDTTRNGKLI